MFHNQTSKIILSILLFAIFTTLNVSFAQQPFGPQVAPAPSPGTITILGINLGCDPALPPKAGGCGLPHFINLLSRAIEFLLINVIFPLAVLMLIWAGFVIMTAGGSAEKAAKGRKIIWTAVVGIAVTVLAAAAVGAIYSLITDQTFTLFP